MNYWGKKEKRVKESTNWLPKRSAGQDPNNLRAQNRKKENVTSSRIE